MLKGIAVSDGIVIAKAYRYEFPEIIINARNADDNESKRINEAIIKTKADFELNKKIAFENLKLNDLDIFDTYIQMLSDPLYINEISKAIDKGYTAEVAIRQTRDNIIAEFEDVSDPYIKERTDDIKDVSNRILCNLLGVEMPDLVTIDYPSIVIAKDLSVTDLAMIDRKYVLGIALEDSSLTSHLSITAKSIGLPTCVGIKNLMNNCKNNDLIILDGINGNVIINPDDKTLYEYNEKAKNYEILKTKLEELKGKESITIDNHLVKLVCNITSLEDLKNIKNYDGEGIGLFRTEFMYLNRTSGFPNEDEQFNVYKSILESSNNRVVIRTLDIGGDKRLSYYNFPQENNPFLGYRAIRFCLDKKDIFMTQIRALLKASIYGKLAIMFPMISTIDEIKEAKKCVLKAKEELINEGYKVADSIEIGMMMETPAAAIMADEFAKEVDFFSIGSNDLIQYTMAADRQSEKVSYLYQPLNPSVLRLVKMIIDGAHKSNIWCGMCGEMASDQNAIPLLLGLGLDEFSMSPSMILKTRNLLRNLSYEELKEVSLKALTYNCQEEVIDLVKKYIK